jgi:hypothetical protein
MTIAIIFILLLIIIPLAFGSGNDDGSDDIMG